MNQLEFLAITYNVLKAKEIFRVQAAVGFGFIPYKTGVAIISCVRDIVVWKQRQSRPWRVLQ